MDTNETSYSEEKLYELSHEIDAILRKCIHDCSIPIQSEVFRKSLLKAYELNTAENGENIISSAAIEIDFVHALANSPSNLNDTKLVFE
jgi:hypothetical protein